ncbi:MAG: alfa-L-rhamnosidase, partial [Bacteroidia bacterium]|nr:alfa-L-rhamnosidase [Bacteroidia bacterium]
MKILIIAWFLGILLTVSCTSEKIRPEVTALRCEYVANPLGLDVSAPRLSWQMKKEVRGARQTAYRIIAATSDSLLLKDTPDLWDSGEIKSGQSIQVVYAGKPLQSGMGVSWKVQIRDENNQVSAWSYISH